MGDEEKTRSGRKQANPPEGETVAGAYAGEPCEPPQFAAGPQTGAIPRPTPPPLTGTAVQAAAEYAQIAGELAVGSSSLGAPSTLQAECPDGFWCLPDVNCSARDFSVEVGAAFDRNRRDCAQGG